MQAQAGMVNKGLRVPADQTYATGLIKHILRTEGVFGLYRGISLNFCRFVSPISLLYICYNILI